MIDFHSHFLFDMDDGSKSAGESLRMLRLSYETGVDTIVSTPHFFAYYESIEDFLHRRYEKLGSLNQLLGGANDIPHILAGAETAYFSGISREEELPRLCIGASNAILIEMPHSQWSSQIERELDGIILNRGLIPIIAHIERYLVFRKNAEMLDRLLALGAVAQINAGSLTDQKQRRPLLQLIRRGGAVVLGSDCHNMDDRRPNLDRAADIIRWRLGVEFLDRVDGIGRKTLQSLYTY